MITYRKDDSCFNFRIAGVAIHEGRLLIHRYEGFDFWALPGGRAELHENSLETIQREMQEELNEEITVDRMLWCCESFFEHDQKNYHELCFYYLIQFDPNSSILTREGEFETLEIDNSKLTFKWHTFEELEDILLYPTFIKEKIRNLSPHIEHIIACE